MSVHFRFLPDSTSLRLGIFAVVPAVLLLASISCVPKDSSKGPNPAQPPQSAVIDYTGAIIEIESDSQLATIVEAADVCVVLSVFGAWYRFFYYIPLSLIYSIFEVQHFTVLLYCFLNVSDTPIGMVGTNSPIVLTKQISK